MTRSGKFPTAQAEFETRICHSRGGRLDHYVSVAVEQLSDVVCAGDRLVGLVVKASGSRAEDPWFESRLRRDISASNHTSDLKTGTPVATLPRTWGYRVSAVTGRPGVSIL